MNDDAPTVQKKVCMLGAFAVGKTSLVRRFVHSIFDERYHTTVGVKIDKKVVETSPKSVTMVLWDLAGHDEFSEVRPSHLRGASGCILVIDRTRPGTLVAATTLYNKLREVAGAVPCVVALNKSDLVEESGVEPSIVSEMFPSAGGVHQTSALTGEGVEAAFHALALDMLKVGHD